MPRSSNGRTVTASIAWRNDFESASILWLFYIGLIVLITFEIPQPSLSYPIYVHTIRQQLARLRAKLSHTYLGCSLLTANPLSRSLVIRLYKLDLMDQPRADSRCSVVLTGEGALLDIDLDFVKRLTLCFMYRQSPTYQSTWRLCTICRENSPGKDHWYLVSCGDPLIS